MDLVHEHLHEIVKSMYQAAQASGVRERVAADTAGAVDWLRAGLEDVYVLVGRERAQAAMQLVDRGVTCLVSDTRSLFRVGRTGAADKDVFYCILPGRYCMACAASGDSGSDGSGGSGGGYQMGEAVPCAHVLAVLLAVAQSRHTVEELPPQEMATALFSIT
ncbi:hypothetical protein GGI07_005016 [Coemansia sp. Benny D115]|nr:hypothetical protein GGI07_005016 [Coemansia sp. Benny D115]